MAFGSEVQRERYRATEIRLTRRQADYVFTVWACYDDVVKAVDRERAQREQDALTGVIRGA